MKNILNQVKEIKEIQGIKIKVSGRIDGQDISRLVKKIIPAKVESIEYDPNRTGFIMRVCYFDGERRYHLVPEGINVGETVICALLGIIF